MRACIYLTVFIALVFLTACFCGCVTPTSSTIGTQTPVESTYSQVTTTRPPVTGNTGTMAPVSGVVDTTIDIHFDDYKCLDVAAEFGEIYLNPDERYSIRVSPPANPVNVNLLLIDVGDLERIQVVEPEWNTVTKTWEYAGLVPLVRFDDVSTTLEKTVTIKKQGKYYLCADDRKESGINDAMIRVPVRITRV